MFDVLLINKPIGLFEYNKIKIPERNSQKEKFTIDLVLDPTNEDSWEKVQGLISDTPLDSLLTKELPLSGFNIKMQEIRILGEYFPQKKEIIYYANNNFQRIVQIHERYHAIHHLTVDPITGLIWTNFSAVDSFYIELLAQLFTYRYIVDFEPQLEMDFLILNQNQSFKYRTWKFFESYDSSRVINLYWVIRNLSSGVGSLKMFNYHDLLIKYHLSKALTFLCKNPSVFVSEADVHNLIIRELMNIDELNPDKCLIDTSGTIGKSNKAISSKNKYKTMLMHSEYGHENLPSSRSDISIFNRLKVEQIDDPINLKSNKKWLVPDYIFELGTEKSAGSNTALQNHIKNDLDKLALADVQGYLIHIHRNFYISYGARKTRNKVKYLKYLSSIKTAVNIFKNSNNANAKKKPPKLVIIKIDLGGDGRVIKKEGKVSIIKDPYNAISDFTPIESKRISSELQALIF